MWPGNVNSKKKKSAKRRRRRKNSKKHKKPLTDDARPLRPDGRGLPERPQRLRARVRGSGRLVVPADVARPDLEVHLARRALEQLADVLDGLGRLGQRRAVEDDGGARAGEPLVGPDGQRGDRGAQGPQEQQREQREQEAARDGAAAAAGARLGLDGRGRGGSRGDGGGASGSVASSRGGVRGGDGAGRAGASALGLEHFSLFCFVCFWRKGGRGGCVFLLFEERVGGEKREKEKVSRER